MALPRPHTRRYCANSRRRGRLHTSQHCDGYRRPSAYFDLPSRILFAHVFCPAAVGVFGVLRSPRVAGVGSRAPAPDQHASTGHD